MSDSRRSSQAPAGDEIASEIHLRRALRAVAADALQLVVVPEPRELPSGSRRSATRRPLRAWAAAAGTTVVILAAWLLTGSRLPALPPTAPAAPALQGSAPMPTPSLSVPATPDDERTGTVGSTDPMTTPSTGTGPLRSDRSSDSPEAPGSTGVSAPQSAPTAARTTAPAVTSTVIVYLQVPGPVSGCSGLAGVSRPVRGSGDAVAAVQSLLGGTTAAEAAQGYASPFDGLTGEAPTVKQVGGTIQVNLRGLGRLSEVPPPCRPDVNASIAQTAVDNGASGVIVTVDGSQILWWRYLSGL